MKKYVLTILIAAMAILFNITALAEDELYSEAVTETDSVVFCGEENSENLTSADNPSDESGASEEPSVSAEPTNEPNASVEPSPSTEPSPSDKPVDSDEPSPSTEPSPSDKPVASDEPSSSTEPSPSDKPVDSDELSPSEQPTPSDKPENSDTTDDSSATDQNDEETESVEIIDIITSSSIYLQFFPTGQPVGDIELPEYVYAQTGPRSFLECDVDWENANEIDTSAAGRQVLRGTLIAPEGISFDGGLEPVVEIPLLMYDENGEGTEVLMPSEITSSTILIPLNANPDEYINTDNQYTLYTQNGDRFYAKAVWEDIVPFTECGEYTVTGRLALPCGIKAEQEEDLLLEQKFFVMKEDKIYLDFVTIENGEIVCTWLKAIDDSDNIEVYYSPDNEDWQVDDLYGFAIDNAFIIPTAFLTPDTNYYFRLKYDDEFTDILFVNITADEISGNIIQGDRDGGDTAHQELPAYIEETKPSSSASSHLDASAHSGSGSGGGKEISVIASGTDVLAESKNSDTLFSVGIPVETSAPSEMTDSTTTEISGARIEDMLEVNPNNIVFEKDGISVELAPDFVDRNNIKPDDIVNVAIDRKGDRFTLNISAKGNEINEIPGTVVKFPISNDTAPTVTSDDGTQYQTVLTDNIASLEIDKTGTYTSDDLADDKNADNSREGYQIIYDENADNDKDGFPVIYCIIGAIVIAAAAVLLWRKLRHGK